MLNAMKTFHDYCESATSRRSAIEAASQADPVAIHAKWRTTLGTVRQLASSHPAYVGLFEDLKELFQVYAGHVVGR